MPWERIIESFESEEGVRIFFFISAFAKKFSFLFEEKIKREIMASRRTKGWLMEMKEVNIWEKILENENTNVVKEEK